MTTPKTTRKAAPGKQPAQPEPAAKPAKTSTPRGSKKRSGGEPRRATKQAALIKMLERPKGATIAQMCAKTGWQSHSVRAALTGLRKRGLAVTRTKTEAGTTIYRAGTV
jgi:hypothetical protein